MNNLLKNVSNALICKLINVFGPFVVRSIIIYILGNEYVGITSLFTAILQVLNLAELGIGSVLTFYMYRPIVDNNIVEVETILNFYKKVYFGIGIVIIGIAIIITPVIPYLIKGSWPNDINIYILFWIYILNTALSYLFFSYRSSLFIAYQKNNVVYMIETITKIIMFFSQSIVLILYKNIYFYAVFFPLSTIINNSIIFFAAKKIYPNIRPNGIIEKEKKIEIITQVKSLCVHRVAGVLILSLDNIVISALLGLNTLALFSNYNYVVTAVCGFVDVTLMSITSTIGTKTVKCNDIQKYELFKKTSFISNVAVSLCCICLFNFYQFFIVLWVGEINTLSFVEMCCFCLYFYTYRFRAVLPTFRDATGLWEKDVWKSVVGLAVNLVGNVVLVKYVGLVGVLLTTSFIMFFIFYPWETFVLFKYLFRRSAKEYVINTISISIITCVSMVCMWLVKNNYLNGKSFVGNIIGLLVAICIFFFLIMVFFYKQISHG